MKTTLITNGNLSSMLALGSFINNHHSDISSIFITTRLPSQRSNIIGIISMIKRSGFRYTYFKVYCNKILPFILKLKKKPYSISSYISYKKLNIPIYYCPDINSKSSLDKISETQPEILLSFSSTAKFCDKLIDTASKYAINAHYAILPGYAGLSPYFWYLKNKEDKCGVTLHVISSKLDAGPMIEQRCFDLNSRMSVLYTMLMQANEIPYLLENFYSGKTSVGNAVNQDMSLRSYYGHPAREQVLSFIMDGYKFKEKSDIELINKTIKNLVSI